MDQDLAVKLTEPAPPGPPGAADTVHAQDPVYDYDYIKYTL